MSLGVYLYFSGNCREAIEFYKDAFRADEPKVMTYGDIPGGDGNDLPDAVKKLVLHASMKIAGEDIMMSDASPDRPITVGNNISVLVSLKTVDQVNAVFDKLKAGGQVIMEVQKTFFSSCYAYLTDKFGISWQLSVDAMKD